MMVVKAVPRGRGKEVPHEARMQGDGSGDEGVPRPAARVPGRSRERAVPVLCGRAGVPVPPRGRRRRSGTSGATWPRAFPCAEAWDCISRYIYTALQGGSIMHGWTRDDRLMVACCNDGTRRSSSSWSCIDIPETLEEEAWLASQDFANTPEDAYTGEE